MNTPSNSPSSLNIVTIGDVVADLVMPVKLPIEPGQSQQMAWHSVEPGGAGNFLIEGQRLGAQMYAVGAVGHDLYGSHVIEVFQTEGVNTDGISVNPRITTTVVAVIFEPDSGKFCYVWHGGHGEAEPVSEPAQRVIDGADALFLQGFTLCEASLRPLVSHALESDKPVWYDVGPATRDVPETDRTVIRRRAQYLLTTADELPLITQERTGQAAYDFLWQENPGLRLLVVKQGAKGCSVVTPQGAVEVPGFSVTARDLVGAGDCFNAAYIYGTLRGLSPTDAATLANATGAAKVMKLGTGRAVPTRAEVLAVLKAGGKSLPI